MDRQLAYGLLDRRRLQHPDRAAGDLRAAPAAAQICLGGKSPTPTCWNRPRHFGLSPARGSISRVKIDMHVVRADAVLVDRVGEGRRLDLKLDIGRVVTIYTRRSSPAADCGCCPPRRAHAIARNWAAALQATWKACEISRSEYSALRSATLTSCVVSRMRTLLLSTIRSMLASSGG